MVLSSESVQLRLAVSRSSLESFDQMCVRLGYPRSVRLMLLRLVVDLALEAGADSLGQARLVVEHGVSTRVRRGLKKLKKVVDI